MTDISHLPDPERARKNIETFLSDHPGLQTDVERNFDRIASLFSSSQFLANYCAQYPESLFKALDNIHADFDTNTLAAELNESFKSCRTMNEGMKVIRRFRKDKQIIITIKDLMQISDLTSAMFDMSRLADAILGRSLRFVESFIEQRYGRPENNAFAMISLGKLGAQELNYSSDVDIVFVYRDDGETSGVSSLPGITMNRVSALEYYVKLVEEFTKFISANTEDGFAYRVDLRLRPEGQRGMLALPLKGYEDYYESWGRLWEKAALLRARPVAGDAALGTDFLSAIRPFIYRKYLDIEAIDEIKRMKSQVEQLKSGTFSRDIKRGYGGIREIEFFIQIFQLMYGGKEPSLRERGTLKALHGLVQKGLIGYDDMRHLSENYIFLRTLEHRLQQLNDLQTHSLPTGEKDLEILGKKMGFTGKKEFLAELEQRRKKVRSIYDSLFHARTRAQQPSVEGTNEGILSRIFWDVEAPIKQSLEEELSKRGVRDIEKAIHCLMQIRNNIYSFQTIRGRRLLEEIVPRFVEGALSGDNPDAALLQIVGFSRLLAASESYLDPIAQRPEMIDTYDFVFSHSDYLSKILMSNPEYMESLVERTVKRKPLSVAKRELGLLAERSGEPAAIRLFKKSEEVRLGMLFLNGGIDIVRLMKGLSTTAEAVLATLTARHSMGLTIAGFGKLGGREIIFNSDLDIVFVTLNDPEAKDIKDAENLLKTLMSYTKDGVAYKVDTRLRPDGSKGPLVVSLKGIADYYLKNAHTWELQALLKARPVSGNARTTRYFIEMRKEVLMKRASEITIRDIRLMRDRISRELSRDDISAGIYDVKLGPGGLEELEFAVQYLQLRNCNMMPALVVQGTPDAVRRLGEAGILSPLDAAALRETYILYRTIETVLRLRNETVLKEGSDTLRSAAKLLGMTEEGLMEIFDFKRRWVSAFMEKTGD
ncbi:MAG TPA: bifunctional [glutamate--ammonia ligase]-adenylyl-L-tyrosine phosphorylase/[glutamate--ammonia-ligase] adenylyltransferase [Dissulfurispiraceae bacterium]|nr:bifunctional [glutamate--ammonia ligase]-adenylyl-L-tyrosine phosphorylase/[glutamate--ammonia-ligase] adenylyltransferase [Dissulfurispiraceae bacterium]